jgi:hypothetical protein
MIFALLLATAGLDTPILVYGIGGQSCATAFSSRFENDAKNWISGFWTGLNQERSLGVGENTDFNGIVGEIRLLCAQHPSATLLAATNITYEKMARLVGSRHP